jgi:hypothetical protein
LNLEAALYYLVVPLLVILAVGGSIAYAVVRLIR